MSVCSERVIAMVIASTLSLPSVAAASTPGIYAYAPPKVTPADAASKRADAQATGRQLREADPSAAGVHYDTTASEFGDPVLYLDAADAYYDAAEKDADTALAEAGIERARIALDLLFFQLDASADKNLRMVEAADIPDLIARANIAVKTGEDLLEKLREQAEGAAAGTDAPEKKAKRQRKPVNGRALFVSGVAFTAIGAGVLALGGVGLVLGAVRQNKAEDPTVYGSEYDDVAAKGRNANLLAGVGLGVGGALVVGGVVMMIVGKRVQKKAGAQEPAEVARLARKKSLRVSPSLNGVAISGRF